MSAREREKLLAWLDERQKNGERFRMEHEIEKYCRADVYILAKCTLKFRTLLLNIADVDPFTKTTIAGVAMKVS